MRVGVAVVGLCLAGGVAAADADLELIVRTGDTLPGLADPVDIGMHTSTSATGEVIFPAFTANGSGLYRWTAGSTPALVGTAGSSVAGLTGTFPFVNTYDDFTINASGGILLVSDLGEWYIQPRTGSPTVLFDTNTSCPDPMEGTIFPEGVRRYSSSGGVLAFGGCGATMVHTSSGFAEYLEGVPPGFGAQWSTNSHVPSAVAPNGDIAVVTTPFCNDPPGPCPELSTQALYRIRNGTPTLLVKRGDTITGAPGPVSGFSGVSTSADGGLAALVYFDDGLGNDVYGAIHVDTGGTVRLVAKVGDTAPGGLGPIVGIGHLGGYPGEIVALTGNRVGLKIVTGSSFEYNTMIRWSASNGQLEKVWTYGEPLLGTDITISFVQRQLVTPSGRVVLSFVGNSPTLLASEYLVREQADGTWELLVRNNSMVAVNGLAMPFTVTGFHLNDGQGTSADGYLSLLDESGGLPVMLEHQDGLGGSVHALVYVAGNLIVNSYDDDPLAGGATSCTTGQTLGNGVPECTLRAAIQVANARGNEATITFALPSSPSVTPITTSSELPTITVPLTIDGSSEGHIEIETNVSGTVGLRTTAKLVVRAINIRGFGYGGILGSTPDGIEVYDAEITDNADAGVANTNGPVRIGESGSTSVTLARNAGPGAFATADTDVGRSLIVTRAIVEDNEEAGLISDGTIVLVSVLIRGNAGPGALVVEGTSAISGITVFFEGNLVATTIENNLGDGLRTEVGDVVISSNFLAIENNIGWGIRSAGGVTIGNAMEPATRNLTIAQNGGGQSCPTYTLAAKRPVRDAALSACSGGGVLSLARDLQTPNEITDLSATGNLGPAILANAGVTLAHVAITGNAGPGVVVTGHGDARLGIYINTTTMQLASSIYNNDGDGLWSDNGPVEIRGPTTVTLNKGWGIRTAAYVWLGNPDDRNDLESPVYITLNGTATTCIDYDIVNDEPVRTERPCSGGGGVLAENDQLGNTRIFNAEISNNGGPGVLSAHHVMLSASGVIENYGPGIAMVGDALGRDEPAITTGQFESFVTANHGDGLFALSGSIDIASQLGVWGNAGRGIAAEWGHITIAAELKSRISDNGEGTCFVWTVDGGARVAETPCAPRDGLYADGDITATRVDVTGNVRHGVNAGGRLRLSSAAVCGNGGNQIVAGASQTLDNVTTDCGENTDKGCLSASPRSSPPWLVALAVLLLLRRRRR